MWYHCMPFDLASVTVSPSNTVAILMHNQTFFVGDNTSLQCFSLGGPNNTYLWLHNQTIAVGYESTLSLSDINAQNGGQYSCIVVNNAGNGTSQTDLYVHPYFLIRPEANLFALDQSNVTLNCSADGFPRPNITWEVVGEGFVLLEEFNNEPLTFSPVTFSDVSFYRCVARAETGGGIVLQSIASDPSLLTGNHHRCSTHLHLIHSHELTFTHIHNHTHTRAHSFT